MIIFLICLIIVAILNYKLGSIIGYKSGYKDGWVDGFNGIPDKYVVKEDRLHNPIYNRID